MDELGREQRRQAFGRALSQARRSKGLSQSEVAALAGVTQSNISAWESGRWAPDAEQCFALESGLGVSPGHLSHHLGFMPLTETLEPCSVERAVLEDEHLDELDRRAVLGLYRELAARPKNGRTGRRN